ncbi:hypothetical protein [Paludisphaera mucosa]|uniref:Anti sigma-E protein RseA N-terminal domain-containing protein n=1 Tax=Paludisphaera mucosa TaxID=3030827 RepID=A0ABT6FK01_9BACT|nr:hypothetical protein [Paludisphaera mucosa]MDG3007908.1 hypothetical protein [Paludisphaera mucosa]
MSHDDLDVAIDRIVDGGLSPTGLREALARVESARDGWRRCTLAFLEAQCLDEVLRRPAAPEATSRPALTLAAEASARRRSLRPALAAAVALAAFGAGWFAGGTASRRDPGPSVAIVEAAPAAGTRPEPRPDPGPRSKPGPEPIPSWVLNQPMPVSADAQASLQARGYRLDQRRRIVAARLADGRRVVVPVDRVGVRYVGGETL